MTAGLDLFYLFVENVFGSVIISGFAFVALFIFIGAISKMSPISIIFIVGLFVMTFAIGWIGGIAALIFGVIAFIYAFSALLNFINSGKS